MIEEKKFIVEEGIKYLVELRTAKDQNHPAGVRWYAEWNVLKLVPGYVRILGEKTGAEWLSMEWCESNVKIRYTFPKQKFGPVRKFKIWLIKKLAK